MNKSILFPGVLCICFGFSSCTEDDIKALVPAFDVDLVQTETILVYYFAGDQVYFRSLLPPDFSITLMSLMTIFCEMALHIS